MKIEFTRKKDGEVVMESKDTDNYEDDIVIYDSALKEIAEKDNVLDKIEEDSDDEEDTEEDDQTED